MDFEQRSLKFLTMCALIFLLLPAVAFGQHYVQTNLVSSIPGVGTNPTNPQDTQLINPWGLARSATSPWWVSDNGTDLSTLYNGVGTKQGLVVTIPSATGTTPPAGPTGVVFNGVATDFLIAPDTPARFIFVTEQGTIVGWNSGNAGVVVVNNSKKDAIYKGVTIGVLNGKQYLYVANFHSGKIEVYDSTFKPVELDKHAFAKGDNDNDDDDDDDDHGRHGDDDNSDVGFRGPGHGFAPFNVQAIGTNIYVAYAKQDADKEDEIAGAGLGFVNIFDPAGKKLARLEHGPWFNAPWGIAMAPAEFGGFSHALLIGMFGSGQIAAFNPIDGSFLGLMKRPNDSILTIDGLWAIGFGTSTANSGPYNTLFFTAGPNDEHDGLFGTLTAAP